MKSLILCLLLLAGSLNAETRLVPEPIVKDSLITVTKDSALSDTVNLSDIVSKQIMAAQTSGSKSGFNYQVPVPEVKKPASIVKVEQKESSLESIVTGLNHFNVKYTNVTIFVVASILILLVFFLRRWIKSGFGLSWNNLKKAGFGFSRNNLKKAVNNIRLEKPVALKNKKLNLMRKRLSESAQIYDISESTVSGKAKHLNLGKGELMLAAKIKSVQLSKVAK